MPSFENGTITLTKSGYFNYVVCAANGYIFYSDPFGNVSTAGNQAHAFFSSTNPISMCFLNLGVYMTDGSTLAYFNTSTKNMVAYSTTFNTLSTSTDPAPTFCSQNVNWRGRYLLYQDANNPQNIYAARTGNPYDFNYAATDPAAAWAANFSESGQIGQPVTAFIPFNDDLAIVSCIDQMWLIEGDPSDGGSFVLLSEHMGMLGPQAWTTTPNHDLYFVGTSGMYMLRPFWAQYMPPQLLTGQNYDQFFTQLDRNANTVSLAYDEVHKYIHIYVNPVSTQAGSTGGGEHLIFDTRNGGLWPVQYAAFAGPTCVTSFVPGSGNVKQILALGGLDGNIHQIDDAATDDEGTAIQSFITFAPINPFPDRAAILQKIEVDMGETPETYTGFFSPGSTVALGDWFDIAGNQEGPPQQGSYSTGTGYLTGAVNSTNRNFTTTFPINSTAFQYANDFSYFVRTVSYPLLENGGNGPTFNGGNSITIQHPIISTYSGNSTVGYYIGYEVYSTGGGSTGPAFNASLSVLAGPTAADVDVDGYGWPNASTNLPGFTKTFTTDRRQPIIQQRLGGGWFSVTLGNSTDQATWSFERMVLAFTPSGINRQQR